MCNWHVLLGWQLHHNQSLCYHCILNLVFIRAWWYYYAKCVMKTTSVTPRLTCRFKIIIQNRDATALFTSRGLTSTNCSLSHHCNITTKDAHSRIHVNLLLLVHLMFGEETVMRPKTNIEWWSSWKLYQCTIFSCNRCPSIQLPEQGHVAVLQLTQHLQDEHPLIYEIQEENFWMLSNFAAVLKTTSLTNLVGTAPLGNVLELPIISRTVH